MTVSGTVTGNAAQGGLLNLTKSFSGKLEINGSLALANNSTLSVNAGTLKINVVAGSPNVGTGVMATVSSGATLELAGAVSALRRGSRQPSFHYKQQRCAGGGLLVSGSNQVVGAITGSGSTTVNAGASLTASHIVQ